MLSSDWSAVARLTGSMGNLQLVDSFLYLITEIG